MMTRTVPAALVLVLALSLAPQALVCGTVEKHHCDCCGEGNACTCCTIAPLYPEQAAATVDAPHLVSPMGWTPVEAPALPPSGAFGAAARAAGPVHGPPPLLRTAQLRL